MIVTGGRTAAGNLAVTEIYDRQEDRWRDAAPLPLPQAGTASVMVDDGLIVFGGEMFIPESKVFPNVWRYQLYYGTSQRPGADGRVEAGAPQMDVLGILGEVVIGERRRPGVYRYAVCPLSAAMKLDIN